MALQTAADAAEAWKVIRGNARTQRLQVQAMISQLASNDVTLEEVIGMYRVISNSRNQLEELKTTQNLVAYVQATLGSATFNAVTEIETVTAAQANALTWIDNNASGLNLTGDTAANAIANNSVATNRFSPAQTANLRTAMQAIADAISA